MPNTSTQPTRTQAFQRNTDLESLLQLLNGSLQSAEAELLAKTAPNADFPIIFLMGPLRSGTTLFMQWLASSGIFAYPTNLLSRFYGAPITGAYIQQLLTDERYNFRNEILDFQHSIAFESENGKTKGALSPNEFWYFWRRFLPFGSAPFEELDWLPDETLCNVVDTERLKAELYGLTRAFEKPFALKSMILNYNIPFLDHVFEKALFIQTRRDPIANIASILAARKRQLGSESEWYSFKIPEYPQLKDLPPIEQACGQWFYNDRAVTSGLSKVDESRKLVVQYEDFCQNPTRYFNSLTEKLALRAPYTGPSRFDVSDTVPAALRQEIQAALAQGFP
ncbi:Conserved hypothetical protein [gamma proteobacterium HdN1]|nr:Conserved hypothetical protein [gamma proteobacterium HdN1]